MNFDQIRQFTPQIIEIAQKLGIQVDVVPLSVLPQVKDREFVTNIQREAISI
jgi:hypothetical protein